MEHSGSTADREVARVARSQWGVVWRQHLLTAGLTAAEIRGQIAKGTLIVRYRVYRAGHAAPSLHADYLAAV